MSLQDFYQLLTCLMFGVQVPSGAVIYSQQSEYLNQPIDGGSFMSPVPVMENVLPEVQII